NLQGFEGFDVGAAVSFYRQLAVVASAGTYFLEVRGAGEVPQAALVPQVIGDIFAPIRQGIAAANDIGAFEGFDLQRIIRFYGEVAIAASAAAASLNQLGLGAVTNAANVAGQLTAIFALIPSVLNALDQI